MPAYKPEQNCWRVVRPRLIAAARLLAFPREQQGADALSHRLFHPKKNVLAQS
jgi:hypothetical protein